MELYIEMGVTLNQEEVKKVLSNHHDLYAEIMQFDQSSNGAHKITNIYPVYNGKRRVELDHKRVFFDFELIPTTPTIMQSFVK